MNPGLGAHPLEDRRAVPGLPDRGGGEGEQVLRAVLAGDLGGLGDERDQLALALLGDVAGRIQVGDEREAALVRAVGHRAGSGMRVDEEQVDRVGADVEYAESHPTTVSG
ncbi:hypothetical protein ACH61_00428 [Rathayibacter tanaceti]|uniref:Uncharacterized protein n=1 Tax=Rathayibacter tanaceti TaxID=1671680 RepID=A0A166D964_9MICO|nr:hypothetical protein ACH61_00428 [Rathayibacter tanaceti]